MSQRLISVVLVMLFLGACAPSAQQAANMTASASTPTPPPTATPTPPPYDLTLTVKDKDGHPIPWAQVKLAGASDTRPLDANGQLVLADLPAADFAASIAAQGYAAQDSKLTLQRGPNDVAVTLARVPFALLPSEACGPTEKLLYAEDFQDGTVDNWGTYPRGTPVKIEPDPAAPDNQTLPVQFGGQDGEFQVNTLPLQDNVVRRLKYMPGDHSRFHVGWGAGDKGDFVVLSADEISLNSSDASGARKLEVGKPSMQQGVWHVLEISTYQGKVEVWVDGKPVASHDVVPFTEGNIMQIGSAALPPKSVVRIDDISICGLSAPFASLYPTQ